MIIGFIFLLAIALCSSKDLEIRLSKELDARAVEVRLLRFMQKNGLYDKQFMATNKEEISSLPDLVSQSQDYQDVEYRLMSCNDLCEQLKYRFEEKKRKKQKAAEKPTTPIYTTEVPRTAATTAPTTPRTISQERMRSIVEAALASIAKTLKRPANHHHVDKRCATPTAWTDYTDLSSDTEYTTEPWGQDTDYTTDATDVMPEPTESPSKSTTARQRAKGKRVVSTLTKMKNLRVTSPIPPNKRDSKEDTGDGELEEKTPEASTGEQVSESEAYNGEETSESEGSTSEKSFETSEISTKSQNSDDSFEKSAKFKEGRSIDDDSSQVPVTRRAVKKTTDFDLPLVSRKSRQTGICRTLEANRQYSIEPSFYHLCGECNNIIELGEGYFPRYINGVKCSTKSCLGKGKQGQGHCIERRINQPVLKDIGNSTIGLWRVIDFQVPVSCECALREQSQLFRDIYL